VYEEEKALGAHGGYSEMQDAGLFFAFATVRPGGDIDEVERLFLDELEKLARTPVPEAELAKAKRQIEVDLLSGMETANEMAGRIGSEYVAFGRIRPVEERLAAYRKVTAADVRRVVSTYLRDDQRSVVHLVPAPSGEASR